MAWANTQDVKDALSSPTDGVHSAASMPDATLEAQVEEAEGTVRLFLAGTAVPVDADGYAVQPVRAWVRNIAAYLAILVYKRGKDVPRDEPNRLRYQQTMDLLNRIQSGDLVLEFEGVENPDGDGLTVYNLYEGRLFSAVSGRAEWGEQPYGHVVHWPG